MWKLRVSLRTIDRSIAEQVQITVIQCATGHELNFVRDS